MKKNLKQFYFLSLITNMFRSYDKVLVPYSDTAFISRNAGIRNPKDSIKKAAIKRHSKAKRLTMLSKPKRRAIYYYNLRHSVKKYA